MTSDHESMGKMLWVAAAVAMVVTIIGIAWTSLDERPSEVLALASTVRDDRAPCVRDPSADSCAAAQASRRSPVVDSLGGARLMLADPGPDHSDQPDTDVLPAMLANACESFRTESPCCEAVLDLINDLGQRAILAEPRRGSDGVLAGDVAFPDSEVRGTYKVCQGNYSVTLDAPCRPEDDAFFMQQLSFRFREDNGLVDDTSVVVQFHPDVASMIGKLDCERIVGWGVELDDVGAVLRPLAMWADEGPEQSVVIGHSLARQAIEDPWVVRGRTYDPWRYRLNALKAP